MNIGYMTVAFLPGVWVALMIQQQFSIPSFKFLLDDPPMNM